MTRVGIGFDSHRLVAGRRLILGGIAIEHTLGLDGHSDADVLTHAIIDALLGAAGLGDIGLHFPDTDARFRDADSLVLLSEVVAMVEAEGFKIGHIDATVIAEAPKLGPHREAITELLADILNGGTINVKFTTAERIGALGRGEGIAAQAVATVE
ncbi:MAG TPA: 2-C-methyl-D-erythritol 2,4-cyclodiphosphate synthase [Baekduia sp.]|nr:2-C-methyl-D-erythritol 2,4-cyclodiphosphate synthase [Baekduia sp.]